MGDAESTQLDQDFASAFASLDVAIKKFKELNERPEYRCRELSLAITEIQTGELWANTAFGELCERIR